jgi:hypothetical protein
MKCTFPSCECVGGCKIGTALRESMDNRPSTPWCRRPPKPSPPPNPTRGEKNASWFEQACGKPCPYCSFPMGTPNPWTKPTRDHVYPRSKMHKGHLKNGVKVENNMLTVCKGCNEDKGSWTLLNWFNKLMDEGDARAVHVAKVIQERRAQDLMV